MGFKESHAFNFKVSAINYLFYVTMEPNDTQLHVLTNFQIFIPLSGDAETIVFTQTTTPSFGLTLTRTDTQDSYHYQFQILHISSNGEEMISNGLAWAKRTPYQFQKKYNTSIIEALKCRLKITTGVFDFRRNKDRSIRLVVRCFSQDVLLSTGVSEPCKVYPKKRVANEESDEGNVIIPISWIASENQKAAVGAQSEFLHSSPDEYNDEDSIMANFNDSDERYPSHSIEGDSDDLSPIQLSNASFAISELQPMMPNDHSDQYMVLYNGNAEVIGNFRALNFYKASDMRIKEDVRLLSDDHDPRSVLLKIDGVEYKFKQGTVHHASVNKRFVGYIAQQIESVVPEAVQLIDGILHVDYESLIPYLSESIKQNFKDINDIKSDTSQIHQVIDMMYKEFVTKECQKKNKSSHADQYSHHNNKSLRWIVGTSLTVLLLISVAIGVFFILPFVNPSSSPNQPTTPTPSPNQPTTPESPSALTPSTTNVPSPSISPLPAIPSIDQEVLVELYSATGGGSAWKNTTLPSISVCDWPGVTCNNDFRVISIIVNGRDLTGTIPDSIGRLDKLEALDLSLNTLNGTIPAAIGNLTNLAKLDIGRNRFTGTVPLELFSLTSLTLFILANNPGLSWTIPPQISNLTNLQQLAAYKTGLHGTLPNELSQMTKLQKLELTFNNLTGTVPSLENTSIIQLGLVSNKFSGPVPKLNEKLVMPEGQYYTSIALKNNFFSGEFDLPLVFLANPDLYIDISNNQFTSISPKFNNMTKTHQRCNAWDNPFKCPIPDFFKDPCQATCT